MEATEDWQSNISMEMGTVVFVKNRCQFCYAFFKDPVKFAEHSNQCEFRFSETFEAFDGKLKFACAVCFDVFQTRDDHRRHERLHKFPGGFQCSACDGVFLNSLECVQHMKSVHKISPTDRYSCFDCGAFFEQDTHLRLHIETNCGKHRTWSCIQCNLLTEEAYKSHMEIEHKIEFDETDVFVLPKVEVTLSQNENLTLIEDITKADDGSYIEASNDDPLRLVVKEESNLGADFQSVPDVRDVDIHSSNSEDEDDNDIDDYDDNSIEKSCGQSGGEQGQNIPNKQQVKSCEKKCVCKYCGRKYVSEENMNRHMLEHGPDRNLLYKCDCCFVYFMTRQIRDTHREAEHKEKLTCKKCERVFSNLRCLQAHNRAHHKTKEKEVTCLKCGIIVEKLYLECHQKSYCVGEGGEDRDGDKDDDQKNEGNEKAISESNEQVKPHKESLINDDAYDSVDDFGDDSIGNNVTKKRRVAVHEKKHVCSICDKKYYALIRLQQHIVEHGPDGSLVHRCDCCPLYFESRELRDEHTKTAHKEKLTCSICVRSFINARALNSHKRVYHKGDTIKRLVCAKCGNSYRNFTYLSAHEQSDCGRLPIFKCDECGKFFSTPFSLTKHKEIHSGVEKKFACNLCEKKCRNSTDLRIHQRSHTGEKPYQCDYCKKRFTDVSYMKAHMTMHVGVKRHVCYGCGDRFITNSALHKHRKYRKDTCALVPIKPPLEMKKGEIFLV